MRMRSPVLRKLIVIFSFCAVSLTPGAFALAAQVIPPIRGRIVDATNGAPIEGIKVELQITTSEGWARSTESKETTTTDSFGLFALAGLTHPAATPFDEFESYWLVVNGGPEESSPEMQVLYNPLSNRRDSVVGDKRYFPLSISFESGACDRRWKATCLATTLAKEVQIQLVPTLDGTEACQRIGDPGLRENCRQLNTYRAAFLHVGTYEEMKKGKQLCEEVDGGVISSACLHELPVYDANPQAYDRKVVAQTNEPVPEGMFPDSIAGLPVMKNAHCGPQISSDGRVDCAAGYGTVAKQLVAVYCEKWPKDTEKLSEWSRLDPSAKWSHLDNPDVREEVRKGGKVLRSQGKWYSGVQGADGKSVQYEHKANSYVWFSANTLVEVLFYDPIPEQEAFLSYYLGKFPSTSQ